MFIECVSGPMSGIPHANEGAFRRASEALREMGYAVCNPVETSDWLGELAHNEYLRFDFERVLEADFLVALPGWWNSDGALAELHVATRIGTKVWDWLTFDQYNKITYDDVARAIARKTERTEE